MIQLTAVQGEVLNYMWRFYLENDQLPTMATIAGHFGWGSANNADQHCKYLLSKGAIQRNSLGKYMFSSAARLHFVEKWPGLIHIKEQIKRIKGQA